MAQMTCCWGAGSPRLLVPSDIGVQSLSRVRLFAIPWTAAHQVSLSITNSRSSPRLTFIKSVMPSSHLILCHPLLLLPPIPPSHGGGSAPSCCAFTHRVAFEEGSAPNLL